MTPGQRTTLIDYGSAALAVALAWLVRQLLDPYLEDLAPYASFVVAVIVISWRSGLWPALMVMVLGFCIAFYAFVPPRYSMLAKGLPEFITAGLYLTICTSIAAFSHVMRTALRQASASTSQAEAAIRHAAAIVESSDDAIFSKSPDGIILSWNQGAERLYGYTAEEIVGRPVSLLFPSGEEGEHVEILERIKQGEVTRHLETVRRHKDGTLRDVSVNISPLRDGEGRILGASTIARGISKQKQVEAEIRRLNRDLQQWISEFQTLLDVIPISIAVTDDADCRRIWTNPTMATILQLPRDANASLSAPPSERPTSYRVFQAGKELPVERLPLHLAVSSGREVREMEIDLLLEDGSVVNMLSYAAPLFDEDGKVRGGIFAGIDLTERKQAQEALRRSEQELSDFFENATIGLHWTGPDGVILRANRAELDLLGYERHEYIGHHIAEFHVDEPAVQRILARLQNGERLHDVPAQLRCKDGSIRDVLIDSSVMWEDGRFIHTRSFTRDVTLHKRAVQALEESEQQYRRIIETANEGIWLLDDQGKTAFANPRMAEMLGCTWDELLSGTVWDYADPAFHAELEVQRERRRQGISGQVEILFRRPDKSELWGLVSIGPIFDEQGNYLGALAMISDLTERKKVELTLRESEERLRLALQAGRMGTWEWNIASGQVLWSPSLEAIHGLAPGSFPGTYEAFQQNIHPYDREFVLRSLSQSVKRGEDHRLEYRLIWPDGSIHWVETRGKVIRDEAGQPCRMVGVCMDIDERERLEQELRRRVNELAEAEGRVRSVVNNVIDGIITVNEVGTIESVNPAVEHIFGYAAKELAGQNITQLLPELEHNERVATLANYLRSGETPLTGIGREVLGKRKDGSTFPLDLAAGEFHLRDRRYFTGVVRDITERKRNEEMLRFLADASAALSGLLDYESTLQRVAQLAVPFFADWCSVDMLETEGEVRRVASAGADPAKVAIAEEIHRKFPPDPNLPYGVGQILHSGRSELVSEVSAELLESAVGNHQGLLELIQKLGIKSYMGVPLLVRGQTIGVIMFMTAESGRIYSSSDLAWAEDLARRAASAIDNSRLYAEIREADKRKDEFLATLAHELRNPLTPIRNALQLMQLAPAGQEAFDKVRSTMERQIEQMVRLIDDLLDVSRITRNKLQLRREPLDLVEVIQSAVETCRPLLDAVGHKFEMTLPLTPIPLYADFTRLSQVFANLLNNACKYTEPGGRIGVTARQQNGQVEVRVRDTGIGIPPESLPYIFDMFTQVDASLERAQGGLGIGLTLVRRLVEMHGGSVVAQSAGPGKGSEFIVRLPAAPTPAPISPPSIPAGGKCPALAKRKILVVDDNKDAADTMGMILKMLGNEVRTVYDGRAALEAVETFKPSLLLLDIGLPVMNGYEVARNIRAKHGHEIVIAALTGWGQDEDRRRSKEAGFDHHLVKPASANMLQNLLGSLPSV